MQKSCVGRAFITTYYATSPPVARWLETRPFARKVVVTLLAPIVIALECSGYRKAPTCTTAQNTLSYIDLVILGVLIACVSWVVLLLF